VWDCKYHLVWVMKLGVTRQQGMENMENYSARGVAMQRPAQDARGSLNSGRHP
jgi:hypothetical protein